MRFLFLTLFLIILYYYINGDDMKVKVFDCDIESDLEECVNEFIIDKELVDIKYQVSIAINGEEQIYCFSAMIIYISK